MDWLIRAFGFAERSRQRTATGRCGTASSSSHGGVIMMGAPGGDFRGPARLGAATQLVCITVTDLSAHRERARDAGADVSEISARADRACSYTVDDLEGHRWYFSEPLYYNRPPSPPPPPPSPPTTPPDSGAGGPLAPA